MRAGDAIILSAPCEPTPLPGAKDAQVSIVSKVSGTIVQAVTVTDVSGGLRATVAAMSFAGPVAIAVTSAAVPHEQLSGLATTPCRKFQLNGLFACIDELFANDGPCASNPPIHPDFTAVTALPGQNEFHKMCIKDDGTPPPCRGKPTDQSAVSYTLDAEGNVLLNMSWRDIIHGNPHKPRRRVQGSVAPSIGAGIKVPSGGFLESFNEYGVSFSLPPTFLPGVPAGATPTPGAVSLWGTADQDYSILRIDRRRLWSKTCSGGSNATQACEDASDCPGGSCTSPSPAGYFACSGAVSDPSRAGRPCTRTKDCAGGQCTVLAQVVCYDASGVQTNKCTTNADCGSGQQCGLGLFNLTTMGMNGIRTIQRSDYYGEAGPYE